MQDEGGLGTDGGTATKNLLIALFIDFTVLANYGVHTLRDVDSGRLTIGIEDDDDVTPVIAASIVLQAEGDDASGGIKELQVLAHQMGIAETEG